MIPGPIPASSARPADILGFLTPEGDNPTPVPAIKRQLTAFDGTVRSCTNEPHLGPIAQTPPRLPGCCQ